MQNSPLTLTLVKDTEMTAGMCKLRRVGLEYKHVICSHGHCDKYYHTYLGGIYSLQCRRFPAGGEIRWDTIVGNTPPVYSATLEQEHKKLTTTA